MIHGWHVHRAQHAIGNIARSWNLQEMTSGGLRHGGAAGQFRVDSGRESCLERTGECKPALRAGLRQAGRLDCCIILALLAGDFLL